MSDHDHSTHWHSHLPEGAIPYLIILFNTLLFFITRKLLNRFCPIKFRLFFDELVSTIELCADCSELGVIWERQGSAAYALALFVCCCIWQRQFGQAEACPNSMLEDQLLNSVSLFRGESIVRLTGQALGAFLVAKYLHGIWCWHLTPEHASAHEQRCVSSLQVGAMEGAAAEAMITFISRYVALHSMSWNESVCMYTNSVVTVVLCLAGLDSSGGYFNPILASALTLNCDGCTLTEHIVVYWLGSVFGSIVSRWFFELKQQAQRLKRD